MDIQFIEDLLAETCHASESSLVNESSLRIYGIRAALADCAAAEQHSGRRRGNGMPRKRADITTSLFPRASSMRLPEALMARALGIAVVLGDEPTQGDLDYSPCLGSPLARESQSRARHIHTFVLQLNFLASKSFSALLKLPPARS